MQEVYCPRTPHEKAMQRALIQYRNPKNKRLVMEALHEAGREDLIGNGPECLVRPGKGQPGGGRNGGHSQQRKGKSGERHGDWQRGGHGDQQRGSNQQRGSGRRADAHGARPERAGKRRYEEFRAGASNKGAGKGKVQGRPGNGGYKAKGMGPNKAAGSKGGIRRQGSKRG